MRRPEFYRRRAEKASSRRARRDLLRLADLAELHQGIKGCRRCDLGAITDENQWQRVPWKGGETRQPRVVVVGEAPGRDEALQGEPFVGRAGKVLDQALEVAGVDRDDAWIMNVICCRPPRNDFTVATDVDAVTACRPWFNAQLEAAEAWLVVTCGAKAYRAVMETEIALHKVRGKFQWVGGRLWLPTWHPAYVLRQGAASEVGQQFWDDWRAVGKVLTGEVDTPAQSVSQALGDQLSLHAPGETMQERVERLGWVRIHSEALGDHMVIVDPSKKPKIPRAWEGEPRWTTDELTKAAALRLSSSEMKKIHLAKKALGAKIVA